MTTKVLKQYIISVSHPQVGEENETMTAFSYAYDDIDAVKIVKNAIIREDIDTPIDESLWKFQVLGMQSLEDFTKNYNKKILHLTQIPHPSPKKNTHLRAI
jgi:hypothetical protein